MNNCTRQPTGTLVIALSLMMSHALSAQTTGEFKDVRDGSVYNTLTINNQTWMAQNLRFKAAGSAAPDGKSENVETLGLLYNWEVARGACPTGWRLPNEDDWKVLVTSYGGKYAAGSKLKSNSPQWRAPNKIAAPASGFDAQPAGKFSGGAYSMMSESAYYWSSEAECTSGNTLVLKYNASFADKQILPKTDLLSVRCIKAQ